MNVNKDILKNLITLENLKSMSASQIIDEIASNQYKENNRHLREKNTLDKLPTVIKDILLLADFDTELSMNGILGFIENSTGLFLNEIIDALQRIGATEDMNILKNISDTLNSYGIDTKTLRSNVNRGGVYEITKFVNTHGEEYDEMADKIIEQAKELYIYDSQRNIFDNLEIYIERNKRNLIESI